jgi:hypothetical protein
VRPTSPQMAQALRSLREWSPAAWARTPDRDFQPERFSAQPPRISPHVMQTLVARGYVEVLDRTPRGAVRRIRHKEPRA